MSSSYANPLATIADFKPQQRVAYVTMWNGEREFGTVSSVGAVSVFVRFDKQVARLGWEGTTSQSCDPRDLEDATAGGPDAQ